jgi:hypothetical protein
MKRPSKFISNRTAIKLLTWCFVASWLLAMYFLLRDPAAAREGYIYLSVDILTMLVIGALGTVAIWRIG